MELNKLSSFFSTKVALTHPLAIQNRGTIIGIKREQVAKVGPPLQKLLAAVFFGERIFFLRVPP